MRKILPVILIALFLASCGGNPITEPIQPMDQSKKVEEPKTQKTPDLAKCKEPTQEEKDQIAKYLPKGFKIVEQRRVDTDPPFVFVGLLKEADYIIDLNVFKFKNGKIEKIYRLAKQEYGEYVGFTNELDGKNFWGQKVWDDRVVCPVSFNYGGNGWAQYFNKTFMIENGEFVEPKIDLEIFTVQREIGTINNKPVLFVSDPRFEFFVELYHAVSPSRFFVFLPNEKGVFEDKTSSFSEYVAQAIDTIWKEINKPENKDEEEMIIGNAVGMYINAEAANLVEGYLPIVKQTLSMKFKDKEAQRKAIDALTLINKSFDTKTPLVKLLKYEDDPFDIRFHSIKWKVEEVK